MALYGDNKTDFATKRVTSHPVCREGYARRHLCDPAAVASRISSRSRSSNTRTMNAESGRLRRVLGTTGRTMSSPGVRHEECSTRLTGPQHAPSASAIAHPECGWKRGEIRVVQFAPQGISTDATAHDRPSICRFVWVPFPRIDRTPIRERGVRPAQGNGTRAPPDKGGDQESPFDILAFSWKGTKEEKKRRRFTTKEKDGRRTKKRKI